MANPIDAYSYDFNAIADGVIFKRQMLEDSITQLSQIQGYLRDMRNLGESIKKPPQYLLTETNSISTEFLKLLEQLDRVPKMADLDALSASIKKLKPEIDSVHNQVFNPFTGSPRAMLSWVGMDILNNQTKNISAENKQTQEVEKIKSFISSTKEDADKLLQSTRKIADDSEAIFKELAKKASDVHVSDYAGVFLKESSDHNRSSKKWLTTGIALSVGFIGFVALIGFVHIFPTEEITSLGVIKYNLSNVLIKSVLIALWVFVVTYCFRQFNINRHLEVINKHRANALNSYLLFEKVTGGKDPTVQSSLLLQLAKAIYEQSQTGFIGKESNTGVNSGIVELTKIIGQNNQ